MLVCNLQPFVSSNLKSFNSFMKADKDRKHQSKHSGSIITVAAFLKSEHRNGLHNIFMVEVASIISIVYFILSSIIKVI